MELARNILKENKIVLDDLATRIEVCDILQDLDSGDGKDKNFLKPRSFKLIHDKGTYDAVSLNPDDRHRQRGKYKTNVWDLLMDNGYLIISSCNWTKDELIQHFSGNYN